MDEQNKQSPGAAGTSPQTSANDPGGAENSAGKTGQGSAGGDQRSGELTENLKEFGIDTGRMAEAANEHVSDFQQMLIDEVRARPLRAVCWAATAGLVAGLLWAR